MDPVRPWLFVGKFRDTLNYRCLKANNIEAMLQFAELVEYTDIPALHLAVEDGSPLSSADLQHGISFVLQQHQQDKKVLIACGAGISRSVIFAIAALRETEDTALLTAYQEIVHAHIAALPHPVLWKSLCAHYQEEIPYIQVLRHYNSVVS
ncbi:dual specificity protein phosphatase family protein [Pontibacter toksunensis]|uniref:Dual specificity protein phosphatase family protein n=1 Tax=Pontibacter toksunensis TaxID=1332631 RepID=A0ABW6C383_9BACT